LARKCVRKVLQRPEFGDQLEMLGAIGAKVVGFDGDVRRNRGLSRGRARPERDDNKAGACRVPTGSLLGDSGTFAADPPGGTRKMAK
jgi:hypothetical protein